MLVYSDEFAPQVAALRQRCRLPHSLGKRDGQDSDYESAIAAAQTPLQRYRPQLDEVWILMYTSGTTGRPKGAQIT